MHRPIAIIEIQAGKFDKEGKANVKNCYIDSLLAIRIEPDGKEKRAQFQTNPAHDWRPEYEGRNGLFTPFSAIANQVREFLEGCDFMGFCMRRLDIPLLAEEFYRAGHDDFPDQDANIIDVQAIFHQMEPRTLPAAAKFYLGIDHSGKRGISDAEVVKKIFEAQRDRYALPDDNEKLHELSLFGKNIADFSGLVYWVDGVKLFWNFGKHKDQPVKAEDHFTKWFLSNEFPAQSKMIVAQYTNTTIIER